MSYLLCVALFCVGLYGVLTKRNVLKIIVGLAIMEYSVNQFLVLLGYRMGGRAPILEQAQDIHNIVDPLPQALVLTAIVIGLATTALLVALAIRIYDKYGTFDTGEIRKLRG